MLTHYKIVHTTCHTQWGGLEKRIFNESLWMKQKGHTVIIVAPKDTPLYDRAKSEGFKTIAAGFRKLGIPKDYRLLKQLFHTEQPDIVNTHGNADSKLVLFAAWRAKVPCRILSRHISAHVKRSWYNRVLYTKFSNFIFTTADYTTRHLKEVFKLKDTQIFSIPSGIIPPETLLSREKARIRLTSELKLDGTPRFVGFVGRVSFDKGVSTVIEAFKRIQIRLPDHHLVIVGGGTDEHIKSLKNLASQLNIDHKTHFIGFKENVWPYYRAFDCKILASRNKDGIPFEGVPQALLEAMYSRCPVIGSKSGGIQDIIDHNRTGLLFSIDKPGELADTIMQTFTYKKSTGTRVQTACELVQKKNTIDAMGRTILKIYKLHEIRSDINPPAFDPYLE
ncbi:MAG: glycosyltransferase family 4 protein [Desulfobacteraceae bacterium]|nr:glycosyltransferase family 4 protein [Desulfobacteraceae bacterium]